MSGQRSSACCKPIAGLLVSSKPFTSLPVVGQVKTAIKAVSPIRVCLSTAVVMDVNS